MCEVSISGLSHRLVITMSASSIIFADSRGRYLSDVIEKVNDSGVKIDVRFYPGARFEHVCTEVDKYLKRNT